MRIPVTVILDSLAEGSTRAEILASYPTLKAEHIDAALAYAAELAHQERLLPIEASGSSRSAKIFLSNWPGTSGTMAATRIRWRRRI